MTATFFSGLWQPDVGVTKSLLHIALKRIAAGGLFVTLFFVVIIFPMSIYSHWDDRNAVFEAVTLMFMQSMALTKIGVFVLTPDRVKQLARKVQGMEKITPFREVPDSKRIAIRTRTQAHTNRIFFSVLIFTALIVLRTFGHVPFMIAQRKHYASFWMPFDLFTSPNYELLMAAVTFLAVMIPSMVSAIDSFLHALLVQITGHFRLLRHDIERIREDAVQSAIRRRRKRWAAVQNAVNRQEGVARNVFLRRGQQSESRSVPRLIVFSHFETEVSSEMRLLFKELVVRHNECIWLVLEVESAFRWVFMNQLALNLVATAIAITYVAMVGEIDAKTITSMELALVGTLQFFYLCNLSNTITDESDLVRDAVFSCDWLRASDDFKKSMRITMSRADQPLLMRVAGFVPLSHETFLNIANLAYSYYTALSTYMREQ